MTPSEPPQTLSHLPSQEAALTLFESGEISQAVQMLRSLAGSAAQAPDRAAAYFNDVGNICAHIGELGEAISAFRRALSLSPQSALVWNNLGATLKRMGHTSAAEFAFRQAIARQDHFYQAHQNLAELLELRGETIEAARHHCIAYVEGPREGKSFEMLGVAYYHLGQKELAADIYRQWLAVEPNHPIAQHRLASCVSEGVPDRMPEECVEAMFDAFAPSFDAHLAGLEFQGPQHILTALKPLLVQDRGLRILDAGCGTGLVGPLLKPMAAHLVGVDIAAAMLEKATQRECYDQLEKSELTAFLRRSSQQFDVICACDTFNYFGALIPTFEAAAQALKPGGILVFTVEDDEGIPEDQGWHLAMHGRYVHHPNAIQNWLTQSGFVTVSSEVISLRQELGQPVQARIYAAMLRDSVE